MSGEQQDGAAGREADPYDWDPVYAATTIDGLQKQLAAATAELGRVNRRAESLDDAINGLRQQAVEAVTARNAATERAEKAEAELVQAEAQVRTELSMAMEYRAERQQAYALIARMRPDERFVFHVGRLLDVDGRGLREPSETVAALRDLVAMHAAERRCAEGVELHDEWGVQSADSGRAQVCDDEDHARYLAERYSRFRLPGGDPVRHHVVRRLATGWRDAEAADAAPDGRSATETP